MTVRECLRCRGFRWDVLAALYPPAVDPEVPKSVTCWESFGKVMWRRLSFFRLEQHYLDERVRPRDRHHGLFG